MRLPAGLWHNQALPHHDCDGDDDVDDDDGDDEDDDGDGNEDDDGNGDGENVRSDNTKDLMWDCARLSDTSRNYKKDNNDGNSQHQDCYWMTEFYPNCSMVFEEM